MSVDGKRPIPIVRAHGREIKKNGCPVCGGKLLPYAKDALWDEMTVVYKCRDCGAVTFGTLMMVKRS